MSRRVEIPEAEVLARLAAACRAAGGQRAWARRHDVDQKAVSDVLRGARGVQGVPAPILAGLGLQAAPRAYVPVDGRAS